MTNDNIEIPKNTSKTSYPKFADRLDLVMQIRNCSNLELAKNIYMSPSAVSSYKTGHRQPNFEILRSIALALNVSTDFLLGLSDHIE